MAVIAFPSFQPQGDTTTDIWKQRTISARFRSPLSGSSRTIERPGSEWVCTPRFSNLDGVKRAVAQQFLANCRGFGSRFYMPTFYRNRGSFPATELWPNTAFSSTSGLTSSVDTALTVADGVLRATRLGVASNQFAPRASSAVTVVQYAPYAARFITHQGRGAYAAGLTAYDNTASARIGSTVTTFGRVDGALVPTSTSVTPGILDEATSALLAGDYFELSFASFARCALVDNGPNLLLRSDELDNASWTKSNSSVTANTATSPIGTNIGDTIIENSANNFHYVQQAVTVSSAAADYSLSVALKAGTRSFAWLEMSDGTHTVICYFNLTTGATGTPTSGGANFVNPRAYTRDLGNGWWQVSLVGRKASSSTTVTCRVGLATSISTGSYTGDGASYLAAWRATLAQSGVPTRLSATTSAATSGTAQTGSGLYLKGLPASTNGLLVAADWAETASQSVRARASLNSDAAGLGYFQFEAPLRSSPADNSAVIICNPLIRASLDQKDVEWTEHDDGFSSLEFSAVEDLV